MNYTIKKNDGRHILVSFTHEHMKEALEYWTKERMNSAIPDMCIRPFPPEMERRASETATDQLTVSDADTSIMPFKAGGKLFYKKGESNYVATAEFCADRNIILTAAHCFYDRESGVWAENMIFRRCYDNGDYDQAASVYMLAVDCRYIDNNDEYPFDYGFAITCTPATCEILDYEINSSSGNAIAYGYPNNYHDNNKMVYVTGDYSRYEDQILEMLGNPMGGGCSGGAWVKSGTNKVVSVNSYSYSNSPDNQYGPLFTEDFEKLLEYTKDQLPLVQGKDLRYFTLHNSGAFVARMKIEWTYGESSGTYEESGYHDICVGQDRTIDIASIDGAIPPGAYVRLKVHVVAGKGKTANEEFIYSPYSIEQASYEIIGTTLHNNLMRI